tara:strand:- start:578 stop:835 length:258 start_codon:yes stop_codon:yes gene_type:complete
MFRIFRKRETSSLLGRWGTVLEKQAKNKTIYNDWANTDHCGGELCQMPENNKKEKEKEKEKNNDCDNSMDYMMCAVQSFSLHPKY